MKHLLLSAMLALALAGCGGEAGTESGTQVLDWSRSGETSMRDYVLGDDVGEGSSLTKTLVIEPAQGGFCDPTYETVNLELQFEFGETAVEASEAGHLVVRSVSATVRDNDVWRIEASCDDDLKVPLGAAAEDGSMAAPRVLFAYCDVVLRRGAQDTRRVTLEIFGDERIDVSVAFDEARLE